MTLERNERDHESELGIEYHQHFTGAFRKILMEGEREWLENAKVKYRWDTAEIWAVVMVPRLAQGQLDVDDYRDLQKFCPKMLDALSRQRLHKIKDQTLLRVLAALDPGLSHGREMKKAA